MGPVHRVVDEETLPPWMPLAWGRASGSKGVTWTASRSLVSHLSTLSRTSTKTPWHTWVCPIRHTWEVPPRKVCNAIHRHAWELRGVSSRKPASLGRGMTPSRAVSRPPAAPPDTHSPAPAARPRRPFPPRRPPRPPAPPQAVPAGRPPAHRCVPPARRCPRTKGRPPPRPGRRCNVYRATSTSWLPARTPPLL